MTRSRTCPPAMPVAASGHGIMPFVNLQGKVKEASWFRMEADQQNSDVHHIYIFDSIGGWFGTNAQDFVDELKNVKASRIALHLNTPGGAVFDGVAIYNALRSHPAQVDVTVEALAASAGSFIAQAGDTVTMARGSMMMIHDGSGLTIGNAEDHRQTADLLDKLSSNIASIYAARAGETDQHWRELMKAETWYTAQEAVDAGLADKIDGVAVEDPTNHWDLSIFNYAGRQKAPNPLEVMNQIKETSVGAKSTTQPKNESENGDPEDTESEEETNADGTPKEGGGQEGQGAVGAPTEPQSPANPAQSQPIPEHENRLTGAVFMLNGAATTDVAAVQAHISSLEGFRKDTMEANRTAFVDSLVAGNKILASKTDEMKNFAKSLSPEMFESWKATWDGVASSPLFARHANGNTGENGAPAAPGSELQDKLDTAKEIIKQHRMAGMAQNTLEQTDSWKLLKSHDALPA